MTLKKSGFFDFLKLKVFWALFRARMFELYYGIHIKIRLFHDNTYQKGGWYKKYSDKKYTSSLHKATLVAFIASFVIFSLAQNIFPGLFNVSSPNVAQAGTSSKTWTTQTDWETAYRSGVDTTTTPGLAKATLGNFLTSPNNIESTDVVFGKPVIKRTNTAIHFFYVDSIFSYNNGYGTDYYNISLIYKRSTNEGANWSAPITITSVTDVYSDYQFAVESIGTNIHTVYGSGSLNYKRSTDEGLNWSSELGLGVRAGKPIILIDPMDSTKLAVLLNNYNGFYVAFSVDSGQTWTSKLLKSGNFNTYLGIGIGGTYSSGVFHAFYNIKTGSTTYTYSLVHVRTTDSGNTWSGETTLASNSCGTSYCPIDLLAEAYNHTVSIMIKYPASVGSSTMVLAKNTSTNDGINWSGNSQITSSYITGGPYPYFLKQYNGNFYYGYGVSDNYYVLSPGGSQLISSTVVNSQIMVEGSNTYTLWDVVSGSYRSTYYKKSTDNGATWGAAINISTSTKLNFDYSAEVANGKIQVPFYNSFSGGTYIATQMAYSGYSNPGYIGAQSAGLRHGDTNSYNKNKWTSFAWNGSGITSTYKVKVQIRTADTWGSGDTGYVNPSTNDATYYEISSNSGTIPINSNISPTKTIEVRMELVGDGLSTPTLNDFTVSYDTLEAPVNTNTNIKKTDGSFLKNSSGATITAGTAGGWTNETSAKVITTGLTCTGCGTFTNPYIEVETKPVGTAFDGTTGITVGTVDGGNQSTATLTGLTNGVGYHLQMRTKDAQGRVSEWTPYGTTPDNVNEIDFKIDQTAPTGTVSIDAGAVYTKDTNRQVDLTLSATDTGGSTLGEMRFSNDGTTWSTWENYATTKADWTLTEGDGEKTVYAQFRDNAGNKSGTWTQTTDADFNAGTDDPDGNILVEQDSFKLNGLGNSQEILRPNGPGSLTQNGQYPSTGANWDKVDDVDPDEGTTHVYGVGSYAQTSDLYGTSHSIPNTATINSVSITFRIQSDSYYVYPLIKDTTGTWQSSSYYASYQSYTTYTETRSTRANGTNWTWSDIDALEIGIKLDAGDAASYLTQIYATVNYFAAPPPYKTSGNLTSSTKDNTTSKNYGNISWSANIPPQVGADAVRFQVASNNDNTTWNYVGPDGTNLTYYTTSGAQLHSSHNGHRYIKYKAYLQTADTAYTPTVYDVSIEINTTISDSITLDTTPPSNLSNLKAYTDLTKSNEITQNTWYPTSEPYFEWDTNVDSDFNHYKYCFDTSSTCTPTTSTSTANFVTINPAITFEGTHYMRVVAVDNAGQSSPIPTTFIYKYDATAPGAVSGLSASTTNTSYIRITWDTYTDGAAPIENYKIERVIDPGNQYQIGDTWEGNPGYASFTLTDSDKPFDDTLGLPIQGQITIEESTKYQYRIRVKDISNPDYSIFANDKVYGMTNDIQDPSPVSGVIGASCDGTTNNIDGTSIKKCTPGSEAQNNGFEITVSWTQTSDSGTGVAGYNIYRSQTGGTDSFSKIGTTGNLTNFYRDNDTENTTNQTPLLNDYSRYYYKVTAFDAAPIPNETDVDGITNGVGPIETPDVTAPTAPTDVVASPLGLDSTGLRQKVQISWSASLDIKARNTEAGSGIKSSNGNITGYKLFRSTTIDGTYTDITSDPKLTCDQNTRICYNEDLDEYPSYYYYKLTAEDNATPTNTSGYSNAASVQTASSSVPTAPTGPTDANILVTTKTGNPATDATVGDQNNITFKGSFAKNCANNLRCLVKYELWRSTTNHVSAADWTNLTKSTKIQEFTPVVPGNDRVTTYTYTDTNLLDATTYYYKARALDNSPANPDNGPFYSPLSTVSVGTLHAGWDTTADATKPVAPTSGLLVKVRDTHPNDQEYRNIITWVMLTGSDVPTRNGSNDFARYELHREVLDPDTNEILSDTKVANVTDIGDNYYIDKMVLALGMLKYRYYITIVDNADTDFKYPNNTIINNTANVSAKQYAQDTIIPDKAKPALIGNVVLDSIGVSTAQFSWSTDQDADSLVQFRVKNTNNPYVTIGQIERTPNHTVKIFGLNPLTQYEYQIVSRNYLGNNVEYNPATLPPLTTTGFYISHNPTSQILTTTTVAEISWTTNLNASSAFVEYQLQRQPGDEAQSGGVTVTKEAITANPKSHRVVLKGLRSNRAYTYKIKSISTDNYLSEYPTGGGSNFETFRTKAFDTGQFTLAPSSSNVAERNITSTNAQIVWQTAVPTTTWVDYSTKSGTYDVSSGNNDLTTQHVVVLDGLVPGTRYYYRVRVKDANEVEYTSQEYTFKAVLKPKISGLRISNVTPYTVTISWETNIDTETLINWGKTSTYGEKKGTQGKSKTHEIKIEGLEDNSEYHYQILARDETGEEVADDDKVVRTPLDTEGPKIESVKTDILPLGEADEYAQVIISWKTNKPATTLIQYDEGVIGGRYGKSSIEDTTLSTSHTVIVKQLNVATTYHYRIVAKDKRENKTISNDYNFLTPSKEKSILQLILKSLEETFSWISNVGSFFRNLGTKTK